MTDDGRYFKTAAEANEWLEFDSDEQSIDHAANEMPDHHAEWILWWRASKRLDPWPLELIRSYGQKRHLRYELVCSIGVVSGAENATAGCGFTDDLALATWHAQHSKYPGWDVYDHVEQKHVAGGPPQEYEVRAVIESLLHSLTDRAFQLYPYIGGDEISERHRQERLAEHIRNFPDWEPTSEYIVAPLRQALYRAMGAERAAAESPPPPGALAVYSDGRDLEYEWKPINSDGGAVAWREIM